MSAGSREKSHEGKNITSRVRMRGQKPGESFQGSRHQTGTSTGLELGGC